VAGRREFSPEELALYEVRAQLLKAVLRMEFFARRWAKRGVLVATGAELAWLDGGVQLSLSFRVQRSGNGREGAEKALRALRRLSERVLEGVARQLAGEGVEVEVRPAGSFGWDQSSSYLRLDYYVRPVKVDAGKLLEPKGRRWRIAGDSETWVGGERTSHLKALEAETLLELEPPPTSGTEPEVPEEEELRAEGWIRLHEAVQRYGVPLAALEGLIREGRIQALHGLAQDREGKVQPAVYVLEEEVRKLAEWLRSQGATAPPQ
jgi:hypothetical protein